MLRTKLVTVLTIALISSWAQFAWAYPPEGYDVISTTALVEIYDPMDSSLLTENLSMDGYAVVWRSDPYDTGDGTMRIDTRMDTLLMKGYSTVFGDSVFITLNRSVPSLGAIIQQTPGVDYPAQSFFDVYYQITFTNEPDPRKAGGVSGPGAVFRGGFDLNLENRLSHQGSSGQSGRAVHPDGISAEVSGACIGSGSTEVIAGLPFNIDIYFTTYEVNHVKGVTNGFRIYSPEGATWTIPVASTEPDFCTYFDLLCLTSGFSLDGSGADTVAIGTSVMISPGLPPGWSGLAMSIATQTNPSDVGKHLCIDSCYYPPAGFWKWAYGSPTGNIPPPWGGPYCWEIISDTCWLPPSPPHMTDNIGNIPPNGNSYQDPRKTPIVDPVSGDTLAWIWHRHDPDPPDGSSESVPTWGLMYVIQGPNPPTPGQSPDETILLDGDALLSWSTPEVNQQGYYEEDIQLAQMNLTGLSTLWGPANLSLAPDLGPSEGVSVGLVPGEVWPQTSYLDVYYQVDFPDLDLTVIPQSGPPHMVNESDVEALPPFNVAYVDSNWHPIADRDSASVIIGWVRPIHWVQPPQPPAVCCDTSTGACRLSIEALCNGPDEEFKPSELSCVPNPCSCCLPPLRGNIDDDLTDEISIADLIFLVDYMFNDGPEPPCFEEADVDCSGTIDIGDLIFLVDFMFTNGPDPCPCDCDRPDCQQTSQFDYDSSGDDLMRWSALVNPVAVPTRCSR